jgi:Protein of unknown function (DUF4239)
MHRLGGRLVRYGGARNIPRSGRVIPIRARRVSRLVWAASLLGFFCAAAVIGYGLRPRLLGSGTSETTINFVNVLTGFLVTPAAIVMGLMVSSAKNFVDSTRDEWAMYAGQLLRFDRCVRNLGSAGEQIRCHLQTFVAAGIAHFWRMEPAPTGVAFPSVHEMHRNEVRLLLNDALNDVKLAILRCYPSNSSDDKLLTDCFDEYKQFMEAKWSLLFEPQHAMPTAFFRVLIFWLMTIFFCFGIRMPDSPVAIAMIALSAATLVSVMYTVRDMVDPYQGAYNVPSDDMSHVLKVMLDLSSGVVSGKIRTDAEGAVVTTAGTIDSTTARAAGKALG